MNGAQVVVEALKREGVKYIFGYPGGACMPIFDALLDAPELELVLVRHEQGGTHCHWDWNSPKSARDMLWWEANRHVCRTHSTL